MTDWLWGPDYWLSRVLLQRGIAVIYLVAFTVALNQFPALLGKRGLLPVPRFINRVRFRTAPSIFHLHYSDRFLRATTWVGAVISAAIVVGLADGLPVWGYMVAWGALWVLYLSIVNVGQTFYGFGWESILLEAGFFAIFLGPAHVPPPILVVFMFRWLLFRIEFGAGMIKMRGDSCWRDLTCLYYHHETQPMPGPLSWYFHHLPKPLHRIEVAANHFAQIVVPFGLFAPQPIAAASGAVIVVTQAWLVLSGNFSWLNAVTIVIAFAAFHDSFLQSILPLSAPTSAVDPPVWFAALIVALTAAVTIMSYWPIRNMLSRRQLMNFSFNPLHLVGAYGAFGSITRVRRELVIEGTEDRHPGPDSEWKEYGFKGKPGEPQRRPPQFAPYHLRLDWLMWFVPLSAAYGYGWFDALLSRLLDNDPATLKLLRDNPFSAGPPACLRVRLYRYRFTTPAERRSTGQWWVRTLEADYLGPVTKTGSEEPHPTV